MPNQTPTAKLSGTFAGGVSSNSDGRSITDGKVKSNYKFGSSSKRSSTSNQKIRQSGPGKYRQFDKPENRGTSFKKAEGAGSNEIKLR